MTFYCLFIPMLTIKYTSVLLAFFSLGELGFHLLWLLGSFLHQMFFH